MPGIRNRTWENDNATRAYPLDDAATALSDDGVLLPSDILADLNLVFPNFLGAYAYLGAISVTKGIVTLTIQAAADLTDDSSLAPLAVLSVPQPVQLGRQYPLNPQYPGVGGWAVFGAGAINRVGFVGRFSSPAQSFLTAKAAFAGNTIPVASLGKLHGDSALTGVVRLIGSSPVQIASAIRRIGDQDKQVIAIGLVQPPNQTQSVFSQFLGPCDQRPESQTCTELTPLSSINGVPPDCGGTIVVNLRGCGNLLAMEDGTGAVLDCGLGLSTVCPPPSLPDAQGNLPSDYTDQCSISSPPVEESISNSNVAPELAPPCGGGGLPFLETFDQTDSDSSVIGCAWQVQLPSQNWTAAWDFTADDDPNEPSAVPPKLALSTEGPLGVAGRNVIVWNSFDNTCCGRQVQTDLKLLSGQARHNGGLIFNYVPAPATDSKAVFYYLAEIDLEDMAFQIVRYDGKTQCCAPIAYLPVPQLALDRWYRLQITTGAYSSGGVNVTAKLTQIDGPTISLTINVLALPGFLSTHSYFGFGTNRAATRFSYFSIAGA